MVKTKGVVYIIIGSLIILFALNYSLIWRTTTQYEDPLPGQSGNLKPISSQRNLIGFDPGTFIVPAIIGIIIILFGIKNIKTHNPETFQK